MRRLVMGAASLALALSLLCLPARADSTNLDWSFQLIGNNGLCAAGTACSIGGSKGQSIGWGYEIHNNTDAWLVPFSLRPSVPFAFVTESSYFDFPIVSPHSFVTVMFSPDAAGLYQLAWSNDAPQGFPAQTGVFTLSADWFGQDLFSEQCWADLDSCYTGSAGAHKAAYSASLYEATPASETGEASVPEPGSLLSLIVGLGGLATALSVRKVCRRVRP